MNRPPSDYPCWMVTIDFGEQGTYRGKVFAATAKRAHQLGLVDARMGSTWGPQFTAPVTDHKEELLEPEPTN